MFLLTGNRQFQYVLFIKMLQFFGPSASIYCPGVAMICPILLAIFISMQIGWNIIQVKCKLDVANLSLKHTGTVKSLLKMTLLYSLHQKKIKVDRPHPQNYLQKPPDYRHMDKFIRLLIVTFCAKL